MLNVVGAVKNEPNINQHARLMLIQTLLPCTIVVLDLNAL
jgi:hypothetical protein